VPPWPTPTLGQSGVVSALQPVPSLFAAEAMVCAADHPAAAAGDHILRLGGSAADAAVATNAVMAVTSPHLCGMGGDLFALVSVPGRGVEAVASNGRAGSGADAERLRAEGFTSIPATDHIAATPVPGCVDGWLALLDRFGRLPVADVLEPARRLAERGFPASPTFAVSVQRVLGRPWAADYRAGLRPGDLVRRPGAARALAAIASEGRDGFYGGEFGEGLLEVGGSEFTPDDLAVDQAQWVQPLAVDAFGARLWTVPPPSQGYLTLAAAWMADGLDLPVDADDPLWAHLLIEASKQAGQDRLDVLHEHADGAALLAPTRLSPRRDAISRTAAATLPGRYGAGGTTYLCAVDGDRMGVSLIQSNAGGFGSGLGEPRTGINLQNRGQGFNLVRGHPAEYGPGRRPPHTLAPALLTDTADRLVSVLGTMGGDAQPQVVLQLAARLLRGERPGSAVAAGRWALRSATPGNEGNGFATWDEPDHLAVQVEGHAPAAWAPALRSLGHEVIETGPFDNGYGHAHAIVVRDDGVLTGAADPRTRASGAIGH
jgi:gamma-glutamyltranspeptidase/glutathione hydrolase